VYKDINKYGPDIFHGLSHQIPFSSDKLSCKTVVTVHDLIHKIRPKDFPRIDRMIYERKCKYACANADRVIAISESTRHDIIKAYKTDPDRIEVIYQSCDDRFFQPVADAKVAEAQQLFSLPEEFFLYVGSIVPRKNLLTLVEAMSLIPESQRRPLLVMGSGRKYMGTVVRYLEKNNLGDWVHFLGDVPFELFPAIYSRAVCLIYPSFYEGFGLPVIEALAVGIPVITSNTSSMPEAGGDVSLYVDPASADDIAARMINVADTGHGSEADIAERKQHASKFGGEVTARKLHSLYESVLNS
jgi:glycosyltransferase involved in cell wall biosynthesis